jgi:hypothetical protein
MRFPLDSAVEFEHGVEADLPESLPDGSFLEADSDFALLFVAAQFARYGHLSPLASLPAKCQPLPRRRRIDATSVRDSHPPRRSSTAFWRRWTIEIMAASPPPFLRRLSPRVAMVEAAQARQ